MLESLKSNKSQDNKHSSSGDKKRGSTKKGGTYKAPRDNCLIVIDIDRFVEKKEKDCQYRSLRNNILTIKEQVKDFVIVLISENEIIMEVDKSLGSRSIEIKNCKFEPLNNSEMKVYFECLLNALDFFKS